MLIEAWYKMEHRDLEAVRARVEPILRRCGFVLSPGIGETSLGLSSWEHVSPLHGQPIYFGVSPRTEGHMVFILESHEPRKKLPKVAPHFFRVFSELLADRALVLHECILSTFVDEFTFFTHSVDRGETRHIVKLNDDDSIEAHLKQGDADYWKEAGPKLHFVAAHLFEDSGNPTPQAWSAKIRAPIIESPHGPIFDCGWSQLLPALVPTFSG